MVKTEIEFTTAAIEIPPLEAAEKEVGAVVEFRGMVRELEQGRALAGLYYEAHEPMARHQLGLILEELGRSYPCQGVYFIHRLGFVPVGETSLFVRVLAAHRQPAFQFTMDLIDRLKRDVPIWKNAAGTGK